MLIKIRFKVINNTFYNTKIIYVTRRFEINDLSIELFIMKMFI